MYSYTICIFSFLATSLCTATLIPGTFPKSFVEQLPNPPPWQVHAYNNNTFILRQSGLTDYEKPFLYLLFGEEKAFLLDTGSLKGHPAPTIKSVISEYLSTKSNPSPLEFIIGHSHSHWDHVAGDPELKDFAIPSLNVTSKLIAPGVPSVMEGYGLKSWPDETAVLDLGSRKLEIIPIPGHTADAIVVYDRQTGLLLTGDSVYPGRLYIPQSAIRAFKESHKRLLHFTNGKEISHVLGCHIEQKKTPFEEYPIRTRYQPNEHVLQLPVSILEEVEEGLKLVKEGMTPRQFMFAEFSLVIPEVKDEVVGGGDGENYWDSQKPLGV